jgi:hypothetical protein
LELKELIRSIPSEENLNVPYEDLSPAHLKIYETFFNQIRRDRMTSDRDWPKVAKEKMTVLNKNCCFILAIFFLTRSIIGMFAVTVLRYFKHWAALIKKCRPENSKDVSATVACEFFASSFDVFALR